MRVNRLPRGAGQVGPGSTARILVHLQINMKSRFSQTRPHLACFLAAITLSSVWLFAGVLYDNDSGRRGGLFNPGVEFGDEVLLSSATPSTTSPVAVTGVYVVLGPNGYSGGGSITVRIRTFDGPPDGQGLPTPGTELGSGSVSVPAISRTTRVFIPVSATLTSTRFLWTAQFTGLTDSTKLGIIVADPPSGGSSLASELWARGSDGAWSVRALGGGNPANLGVVILGADSVGGSLVRLGGGGASSINTSLNYREGGGPLEVGVGSLVTFSGRQDLVATVANPAQSRISSGNLSSDATGSIRVSALDEAQARAFLEGLKYENTSENPQPGVHEIKVNVAGSSSSMSVNVVAVNDVPVVTLDNDLQKTITVDQFAQGATPVTVPFSYFDFEGTRSLSVSVLSDNEQVIKNSNMSLTFGEVDASGKGHGVLTIREANVPTGTAYPQGLKVAILARDAGNLQGNVIFNVIVKEVNRAPVLTLADGTLDYTTDEDTVVPKIYFTVSDDTDSAPVLKVSSGNVALVSGDNIAIKTDATGTYLDVKPTLDQSGSATLTLTVTDKEGASVSKAIGLTVRPVNDAPVLGASVTSFSMKEDAQLIIPFTVSDADAGDQVTFSIAAGAGDLVVDGVLRRLLQEVVVVTTGEGAPFLRISAAQRQTGSPAKLTLVARDKAGASSLREFSIDINHPPIITDGEAIAGRQAVRFKVKDESAISSSSITAKSSRTDLVPDDFLITQEGEFWVLTYKVLPSSEGGEAVVTISVKDAAGLSSSASLSVRVDKLRTVPILVLTESVVVEPGSLVEVNFGVDDLSTAASSLITVAAVVDDPNGVIETVSANRIVSGSGGKERTLAIGLVAGRSGVAKVTVEVTDADGDKASKTLQLVVNAPPSLSLGVDGNVGVGGTFTVEFAVSDDLTPASALVVEAATTGLSSAGKPVLTVVANSAGALRALSVPVGTQPGNLVVEVTAKDQQGATTIRQIRVRVGLPPTILFDTEPVASPLVATESKTLEGIRFSVNDTETAADKIVVGVQSANVLAKIPNGAAAPASRLLFPSDGLLLAADSKTPGRYILTLTPAPGMFGTAKITITAKDEQGGVTTRTLDVSVVDVKSPLVLGLVPDQELLEDFGEHVIPLEISDIDTPASEFKITVVEPIPAFLSAIEPFLAEDGSIRLRLSSKANGFGAQPVRFSVDDGTTSISGLVNVTVKGVNDAPRIVSVEGLSLAAGGGRELVLTRTSSGGTPDAKLVLDLLDPDLPLDQLTVSVSSSDATILPPSSFILGADGRALTVRPVSGREGAATVTITATDSAGAIGRSTFPVRVLPASNTPPSFVGLSTARIAQEDRPFTLSFQVADQESTPNELVVSATTSNGSLISQAALDAAVPASGAKDRTFTITPALNQSGKVTIALKVRDSKDATSTQEVVVDVQPVNDAPLLGAIAPVTIAQDGVSGSIVLSVEDVDGDVSRLTFSLVSSNPALVPSGIQTTAQSAGVRLTGSGNTRLLVIRPETGAFGTADLTLSVSDGESTSKRVFAVNVTATANTAPTIAAFADSSLSEDGIYGPVVFRVSDRETPDDLKLSASSSDATLFPVGSLVLTRVAGSPTATARDWRLVATPGRDQSGKALVTVLVEDPRGLVAQSQFTLEVRAVNDPPAISQVPTQVIEENGEREGIEVTITDVDSAVDRITLEASSSNTELLPAKSISVSGSGSSRTLKIKPVQDEAGSSLVTLTARGPNGGVVSSEFEVVVNPAVNLPPAITGLPAGVTLKEDEASPAISFQVNDPDRGANLNALRFDVTSSNTRVIPNLALDLQGTGGSRSLRFTPVRNESGSANITIRVTDPKGATDSKQFAVTVSAVNDAPLFEVKPQDIITDQDKAVAGVDLFVSDPDHAASQLTIVVADSSDPSLLPAANIVLSGRKMTLTPVAGRSGVTAVTLRVSDPDGASSTASFNFVVKPAANTPPSLALIADVLMDENGTKTIPILASDRETPLRSLKIDLISDNASLLPKSRISVASDSSGLTVRPERNQAGRAQVTVVVTDTSDASVSRTFTVVVTAVDDPPEIQLLSGVENGVSIDEDGFKIVSFRVSDPDSPASDVSVRIQSSNLELFPEGSLVIQSGEASQAARFVALRPVANKFGKADITITASDSKSSTSVKFEATVREINDLPVITGLQDIEILQGETSVPMPLQVSDFESPASQLTFEVLSSNPAVLPREDIQVTRSQSDWSLSIKAAANVAGTAPVTLRVQDTNGGRTEATFFVKILAANVPPTIAAPSSFRMDEDQVTTLINGNTPGTSPILVLSDDTTPVGQLVIDVVSSNPALFPPGATSLLAVPNRSDSRQLRLRPAPNQSGQADLTVTAKDKDGVIGSTRISVVVRPVNDLPTLTEIPSQVGREDTDLVIPFSAGDTETAAGLLSFSAASTNPNLFPPGSGLVSDSTLVLHPALDQSGFGTITLSVRDSDGGVTSRTFEVEIVSINDPPFIASIPDQTVDENQKLLIPLEVGDPESDANELNIRVRVISSSNPNLFTPSSFTVTSNPSSRARYTLEIVPAANQSGTATLAVTADDSSGAISLPASFPVVVRDVNQPPLLDPIDPVVVFADSNPVTVRILVDDPDSILVPSSFEFPNVDGIVFGKVIGTESQRSFTLAADATAPGEIEVPLRVDDGDGGSVVVPFKVQVRSINALPILSGVPPSVDLSEDGPRAEFALTLGDTETSPESLNITAESDNLGLIDASGIALEGSGAKRTILLTPKPDQFGTAIITIRLSDEPVGNAKANTVATTLRLNVAPINDPPGLALGNPGPIRILLDAATSTQTVEAAITLDDLETSLEQLEVRVLSSDPTILPNTPEAIQISGTGSSRLLRLTTKGTREGSFVDVTTTVKDQGALRDGSTSATTALSTEKTFRVEFVRNQHAPSVVLNDSGLLAFPEDTISQTRVLTIGDEDPTGVAGLTLSYSMDNPSLLASVEFLGAGATRTVRLTPAQDQFGKGNLTVFARDPIGLVTSVVIPIELTPLNDPPTLGVIESPSLVDEDSPEQVVLLKGVSSGPSNESGIGAGQGLVTATVRAIPVAGDNAGLISGLRVVLGSDGRTGQVFYTPVRNQSGRLTVEVTINDGEALNASVARSFVVSVAAINDRPTVILGSAGPIVAVEGQTSVPRVLTLTDAETSLGALVLRGRSLNRELLADADILFSPGVGGGNPTVSVRAGLGKVGSTEIELTVVDSDGGQSSLLIPVNITRKPTITPRSGLVRDRIVMLQNETRPVTFLVADTETPLSQLQFSASVPSSTELSPGPLSRSGIELSRASVDSSVLTALITPDSNATGVAEASVTVIDLNGGTAEYRFTVEIQPRPPVASIEITPSSSVSAGALVRLVARVSGTGPFEYQWKKGDAFIVNADQSTLTIPEAGVNDVGTYSLLVRSSGGTATASASLIVLTPPTISQHPSSQAVPAGKPLVLDVIVQDDGLGAVAYQWRKGAEPLPNETGSSLVRPAAEASDAGLYSVVVTRVGTESGVKSQIATVDVLVDSLAMSDSFVSAPLLPVRTLTVAGKVQQRGSGRSNNVGATREVGEPSHAGKIGGRSMWVKWVAPKNGAMQVFTRGSSFDTLLGVYRSLETPEAVSRLELVVEDDDGGGSFTSAVEFNAVANQTYYFAVDGRLGVEGFIKFGWSFQETFIQSPDIVGAPVDIAAPEGSEVVFSVVAKNVVSYQWYFNNQLVRENTGAEFRIASASAADVGQYKVVVSNGRTEKTSVANLTLTTDPGTAVTDKSFDVALLAESGTAQSLASRLRSFRKVSAAAASGFRGTQVFNTFGSTTELGEPDLCGIIGGASQWSTYVAPADGLLRVSTEGSSFDTLLGVFTGPADQGFEALSLIACDNNGGSDGRTSLVMVPVKSGTTYYIAVDGPNGQTGIVNLTYSLSLPDVAISLPPPIQDKGLIALSVPGVLGAKYVIQSSVNLAAWRTVLTTNATTNPVVFRDPETSTAPMRFYRIIRP